MAEGEERWTIYLCAEHGERAGPICRQFIGKNLRGMPIEHREKCEEVEVVRASRFEEVQAELERAETLIDHKRARDLARAERAEAERDMAVLLRKKDLEYIEMQRADLERAQELIARLKQELENIDLVAGYDVEALAAARERGEQ